MRFIQTVYFVVCSWFFCCCFDDAREKKLKCMVIKKTYRSRAHHADYNDDNHMVNIVSIGVFGKIYSMYTHTLCKG